jgi:ABC-type Fe3+/spermidine/putrescine transport system ATPase subunit
MATDAKLGIVLPCAVSAPLLEVRSVTKRFGNNTVLRNFSLEIANGEFLTILGESGSGKTTLLRLIAGFELPDEGELWMAGQRLDVLPPFRRPVNTVFQQYALFPHLSVFENVAYGLRIARVAEAEVKQRVTDALAMVKMDAFASAPPAKISGGQQQRIALARALVNRPRLLLLDEPLSALDANLRSQMQVELKALQREVGITFIFVTHDQQEAMAMSDRIALLRNGLLEQVAPAREIYSHPATAYVASFLGQSNLLICDVCNGMASCAPLSFPCSLPDGKAVFSLRPESIRLACSSDRVRLSAAVLNQCFLGATNLVKLRCASGVTLIARLSGQSVLGEEEEFSFDPADAVLVRDSEAR